MNHIKILLLSATLALTAAACSSSAADTPAVDAAAQVQESAPADIGAADAAQQ
ncbi:MULTISPECIES: hypothetical protein [unclassified Neisseria]|uniref:hypothetical protein n=1 Tax=unclassified Neisseria TaxID=2623750 RepID=UPI0014318E58|nr:MULTISPECIES: hypothetical protein [unclassified Neisseria]MBF0804949.1 hypothetical protein [Neisseria sp. 19428wB4_WF04]